MGTDNRMDLAAVARQLGRICAAIDGTESGDGAALYPLVDEYCQVLAARGRTPQYVRDTRTRIRRVLEYARIRLASELAESPVQRALGGLTSANRIAARPLALASRYGHWRAIKSFSAWLAGRRGVLDADPLEGLTGYSQTMDPVHQRHVWTPAELARLIDAARAGPAWRGIGGEDRAMVYAFLVETALRPGTVRKLRRGSFVPGSPPYVTIGAMELKERKARSHPLRDDTARRLAAYLESRPGGPCDPLFPMPSPECQVLMLRADLAAARLPHVDAAGRWYDVYSLRHTALTRLALSGVPMVVTQQIAGHSTIDLTARYYVHVAPVHLAATINALPPLFPHEDQAGAKRGAS